MTLRWAALRWACQPLSMELGGQRRALIHPACVAPVQGREGQGNCVSCWSPRLPLHRRLRQSIVKLRSFADAGAGATSVGVAAAIQAAGRASGCCDWHCVGRQGAQYLVRCGVRRQRDQWAEIFEARNADGHALLGDWAWLRRPRPSRLPCRKYLSPLGLRLSRMG